LGSGPLVDLNEVTAARRESETASLRWEVENAATATATGLLVDAARTPVYLWHSGPVLLTLWAPIIVATVGVLIGTLVGERMLLGLSPDRFGQIIGGAIGALGICMLVMPL